MSRRFLSRRSLSLLLGLGLAVPVALVPASSAAAAYVYCTPSGYGAPRYTITSTSSAPVVTHARVINLPPGGTWSQSTTVSKVREVTAGVTISSNTSFQAGAIFAKAEQAIGVELQASGTSTNGSDYTESWDIPNNTAVQKRYVVFHGTFKKSGSFVKKECAFIPNTPNDQPVVVSTSGTWRSWTVDESGVVRCDLATGALGTKAKNLYC